MDLTAFAAAADLLSGGGPAPSGEAADRLLLALGYDDGDAAGGRHRAALLRLAGRFERLFRLPVPGAPGAVFLGGQVAPGRLRPTLAAAPAFSAGGIGITLRDAFESCVGEAAERLSFLAWGDETTVDAPLGRFHPPESGAHGWIAQGLRLADDDAAVPWLRAAALDGGDAWLPLELCLRRPAATPPPGGWLADSTGCAAGVDDTAALRGGLYEAIERDAAALWWYGAAPPAELRLDPAQGARLAALLRALGRPAPRLLDISSEFGVAVVVAFTGDRDGGGVAMGFGADPDAGAAAGRAVLELSQVELGHALLRHKLAQGGSAALAEPERRALRRLELVDAGAWPQFTPRRGGPPPPDAADAPVAATLAALRRHGYAACRLPLTRPELGIPAVRVVVPGLQGTSPAWITPRLAQAVARHGEAPASLRKAIAFV